jgi:hypothetical protein
VFRVFKVVGLSGLSLCHSLLGAVLIDFVIVAALCNMPRGVGRTDVVGPARHTLAFLVLMRLLPYLQGATQGEACGGGEEGAAGTGQGAGHANSRRCAACLGCWPERQEAQG